VKRTYLLAGIALLICNSASAEDEKVPIERICNPDRPQITDCLPRCSKKTKEHCAYPPQPMFSPDPEYSQTARSKKIQGSVYLEVEVLEDGKVGEVRVVKGLEESLDQNSIHTIRRWRFKPAVREGKRIKVLIDVVMNFRIW
jgi:TonB family protein